MIDAAILQAIADTYAAPAGITLPRSRSNTELLQVIATALTGEVQRSLSDTELLQAIAGGLEANPPLLAPPTFVGFKLSKTAVLEFDGGLFEVVNTFNGKPRYRRRAGAGTGFNAFYNVQWSGTEWLIIDTSGPVTYYSSNEDVATPDLVTAWTDLGPSGGTPEFVPVYSL